MSQQFQRFLSQRVIEAITTPMEACLCDVVVIDSDHLGLMFDSYYARYQLSEHKMGDLSPLAQRMLCPRLVGKSIVGVNSTMDKIILIDTATGEVVKTQKIEIDSKFLRQEPDVIVFEQQMRVAVVFREEFMLAKKVILLDSQLAIISNFQIQTAFLAKYDSVSTVVNFEQNIANAVKILWIDLVTLQRTSLEFSSAHLKPKSVLTVCKRVSSSQCLIGVDCPTDSSWFLIDLDKQTIRLCFRGHSILEFIRIQNNNCFYVGYHYSDRRPANKIVVFNIATSKWNQLAMPLKPCNNFNYDDSKLMIFYTPTSKPSKVFDMQVMHMVGKRSATLHIILNSQLISEYQKGVIDSLFQVIDFSPQQSGISLSGSESPVEYLKFSSMSSWLK